MQRGYKFETREEWLAFRHNYIGGSDAGAVIGLNPYCSAFTLWAQKSGKIPEFEGNITTSVGSYLEDFVADLFTKETGKKVRRVKGTIVNDKYPWACADIDREVLGDDALLEIKTTNSFPVIKKFKNGEYPEQWYAQVMHYLAITGKSKAYIAVLIACRDFQIFEVPRDEDEITALMQAEKDFMERVKNGTPPTPDGTDSTTNTISQLYDEGSMEHGVVDLSMMEQDLKALSAIKGQIKSLNDLADGINNKIKLCLQDEQRGISLSYKISWLPAEKKTLDTKALAAEHPELDLTKYYKTSTYRTLRIAERKE